LVVGIGIIRYVLFWGWNSRKYCTSPTVHQIIKLANVCLLFEANCLSIISLYK
jgi:hypothetical protein